MTAEERAEKQRQDLEKARRKEANDFLDMSDDEGPKGKNDGVARDYELENNFMCDNNENKNECANTAQKEEPQIEVPVTEE